MIRLMIIASSVFGAVVFSIGLWSFSFAETAFWIPVITLVGGRVVDGAVAL